MSDDAPRIDWDVTVQAFALLGYEFKPPHGFEHLPAHEQLGWWDLFLDGWKACELQCAWKGGGPCLHPICPRHVLRRVSLTNLPLNRAKPE